MILRTPLYLLLVLLCLVLASQAPAVIIDSGDGSGNTSAPSPDPGWDNFGWGTGGNTGIYIGNGWVMTAAHNFATDFALDWTFYPMIPGTTVEITHSGSTKADIILFRIADPPSLPALPIRSSMVSTGTDIRMIGRSYNRGAAFSFWNPPSQDDGYYWDLGGRAMRWGTNETVTQNQNVQAGPYITNSFRADFDRTGQGTTHECMVTTGDSGGGAFVDNGGTWELAGLIHARVPIQGQPANAAVYGSQIYVADLSTYRTEILDVITPDCGNGFLTNDEECDDGNNLDGDCCSATCTFESNGSACDDGLFCNGADSCDGAGVCVAGTTDPCDDANACTKDSCDEGTLCTNQPLQTAECVEFVPAVSPPGHLLLGLLLVTAGVLAAGTLSVGAGTGGSI